MKNLGKKAALICATTAIGVTMFASVALAAPVLPAGTTSGPHNSRGDCASCHSFEGAAPAPTPAPAPEAAPAPTPTPAEIAASLPALPSNSGTSVGSPYIVIIMNPQYAPTPTAAQPVATPAPVASQPAAGQSDDGEGGGGDD